jgi:peptidoglycan-N-acetylglucosamine deacetylase
MRHLKWIVLFVVVLSLAVTPVAFAAPAAQYPTCGYWYQVQWGQTLYSLSRATGVSAAAIAQANGLMNPNYIYAGQSLWIPCPPAPPPPSCGYWYTVRWGDTLNSIAWRSGVRSWAIAQANGIYNMNYIYAGQALWIPCP